MATPANDGATSSIQITDRDLRLYATGRLSRAKRRLVEGMLACNADLAAQVMTEMHLAGGTKPAHRTSGEWAVVALAALAVVGCGLSGAIGWSFGASRDINAWHGPGGASSPDYVEDAAESREAVRLRASMVSQVVSPRLDAAEIQGALKLRLPNLPGGWRVVDVQVFPTDDGPCVSMVVETPRRKKLVLFAVQAKTPMARRPTLATKGHEAVAFWQRGAAAFVLSGDGSRAQLLHDAATLAEMDRL